MIKLGTKAETLQRLSTALTRAKVLPLVIVMRRAWLADPRSCLREIREVLGTPALIVRSSAATEDTLEQSRAGMYLSVPEIDGADADAIAAGIDRVLASYDGGSDTDQVLVQPQLPALVLAGVLFTADLDTFAPYFVLSYGASFDGVTSGATSDHQTYVRFRGSRQPAPEPWMDDVLAMSLEIEALTGEPYLDIEFGLDAGGQIYLFQARPLARKGQVRAVSAEDVGACITKIQEKIEALNRPHPDLAGSRSLFGIMPDWNPAEIIGSKPRPLALSLYRELITDGIWAYQRSNYGYRNLRSFPLVVSLCGQPYIDVRVSFNSLIPDAVKPALAHKLADYYMRQLEARPSDHDKVEFNILFTCAFPSFERRLRALLDHGFTEQEVDRLKFALLDITNALDARITDDLARITLLEGRYEHLMASSMSLTQKIYWLIEDCKRYGTLPFVGLARAAFVATQFLHAIRDHGIISDDDLSAFMASLHTVSRELVRDVALWRNGELPEEALRARYGHLRPGTYDILSSRYDETFEAYFPRTARPSEESKRTFVLSPEQRREIDRILEDTGLTFTSERLFAFVKAAIEGREYAKFLFTRNLSEVLRLLERAGAEAGLARDDMSFIRIRTVMEQYGEAAQTDSADIWRGEIARNRAAHAVTGALRLPVLLRTASEAEHFMVDGTEPNYVTGLRVSAPVVVESEMLNQELTGKIALVRCADPGYDWLFSRGIAGFITEYGGVNSHMAVRAAELRIPAVIGCGTAMFGRLQKAAHLEVDCGSKVVRVIA